MGKNASLSSFQGDGSQDVMVAAYRHDVHKLNGKTHGAASDTFHGISVNQTVPHGADGHASALSRPNGKPDQTVDTHKTHYRLSLLTGESYYDSKKFSRPHLSKAIIDLLTDSDPETTHRAWLRSDVASGFNESIYYPYTSLKYHTLLVAALLDNYRAGHEFADLLLIVDDAEEIVPHRTVYAGDRFALRIDENANGKPWARLGSRPRQSWASTWKRLTAHPLDVNHDKYDMMLDANLRRIWSWSTALQYIEDLETRRGNA
ncbi:hypothetical protein [Halorubrum sp. LN27]|uniref:hypothetical protein n=1 Tax=Halorubrum sp. LN27 TaxID=2801032 RepID=UPI0019092340|nr:hypothetical protein [Halorubrum sp. LN27]